MRGDIQRSSSYVVIPELPMAMRDDPKAFDNCELLANAASPAT